MKTLSKSILALLFICALSATSNARDIAPEKTLKKELHSLMADIKLPQGEDFEATVKFLVNEDNQIVIVSVDTENQFVESLIKDRLNYRKIKSDEAKPNKINKVKFTLKQP